MWSPKQTRRPLPLLLPPSCFCVFNSVRGGEGFVWSINIIVVYAKKLHHAVAGWRNLIFRFQFFYLTKWVQRKIFCLIYNKVIKIIRTLFLCCCQSENLSVWKCAKGSSNFLTLPRAFFHILSLKLFTWAKQKVFWKKNRKGGLFLVRAIDIYAFQDPSRFFNRYCIF